MYGCPPGCYASNGTTSVCAGAPAASYALYGGSNCSTSANALESCPRATYSPSMGAARSITCSACPTGSFCPYSGMPHPGGGFPCRAPPAPPHPSLPPRPPQFALTVHTAHCQGLLALHLAPAAPQVRTVFPAQRSSAAATSTRTSPPPAPATATAVLGKLHPPPGR